MADRRRAVADECWRRNSNSAGQLGPGTKFGHIPDDSTTAPHLNGSVLKPDHNRFMDRAIALAGESMDEGNGPVGCVIVKDGRVIGEGRNRVRTSGDPAAHGEMVAIRNVAANRGSSYLLGCTLYSSMEPCPMCCWAILDIEISTLVLGARHARFRTTALGSYSVEALVAMTGRKLEIIGGVREKECEDLRYAALERSVREARRGSPPAERVPGMGGTFPGEGDRGAVFKVGHVLSKWVRRFRKP